MTKTIKNLESLIPPEVTTQSVNGTNHIPTTGWDAQQNQPTRSGPYVEQRNARLPQKI